MRLRLLLLLGVLSILAITSTAQAAKKGADDIEGSANIDNPDDEDFEVDSFKIN
jgi:hypothetical protein